MTRAGMYAIAFALVIVAAWATPARGSDIARADQIVHRYAAGATVNCDGQLDRRYYALTYVAARDVILGPLVCTGLYLYDASAGERDAFARLNPAVNIDYDIGVGILVAIHEAQHAAGQNSEALAQCAALRDAPGYLTATQLTYAKRYDAGLPASYHGETC